MLAVVRGRGGSGEGGRRREERPFRGKKKEKHEVLFSEATPRRRRVQTAPIDLEICGEVPRIV
jgi:hypothetical protein